MGGAQLTEKTAKKWKAIQLVGAGIMAVGVLLMCMGFGNLDKHPELLVLAVIVAMAGFGIALFGAISAWWHHG